MGEKYNILRIVELFGAGIPILNIARLMNVSMGVVTKALRAQGINTSFDQSIYHHSRLGIDEDTENHIIDDYRIGYTVGLLSRKYKVTRRTILLLFKLKGVILRKVTIPREAAQAMLQDAVTRYFEGEAVYSIYANTGVYPSRIYEYLHLHRIPLRGFEGEIRIMDEGEGVEEKPAEGE